MRRNWPMIAHQASGYLLAALGVVHTSLAIPSLLRGPDAETVWFAGTGLGLILLVFLNVGLRRAGSRDHVARRLCHGSNLVFSGFGVLAVSAVPEPQAYAVLAFILAQTLAAFGLAASGGN